MDQRTASTYKGAVLVLRRCNTAAVNLHLAEIAQALEPDAHAVLLVDQRDGTCRIG